MAIDEGVVQLFRAETTITDELANTTSIYVGYVEQDRNMPYITIQANDIDPLSALDGTSGMKRTDMAVNCVAPARVDSNDAADAVESFFNDFTGAAGSNTIDAVILQSRSHTEVPIAQGSDIYKMVTRLEYAILHDS